MDLISQVKNILPDVPDEEIAGHINQFRQVNPNATDTDILTAAQSIGQADKPDIQAPAGRPFQEAQYIPAEGEAPAAPSNRDLINQYLNPQKISELEAKANQQRPFFLDLLAMAPRGGRIASLSDLPRSRNAQAASSELENRYKMAQMLQNQEASDFERGLKEKDESRKAIDWDRKRTVQIGEDRADSPETEVYRQIASDFLPSKRQMFNQMTAAQIKEALPSVERFYNSYNQRLEAAARLRETMLGRQQQGDLARIGLEEKREVRDEKKKALLNEVEDRRTNIHAALDELDTMIENQGTFEALGPHNQNLDRLIDQVATDMAKLQDPNSVARPGEVALVKKNLIESGFKNRNATARDIIKTFRQEVERRAEAAYSIRGLPSPSTGLNVDKLPSEMTDEEVIEAARKKGWID